MDSIADVGADSASQSQRLKQLESKERTFEDLSRFIGARTTGFANYSLLLGAGCSVSSNIRSASSLVEEWRKEIFERYFPGKKYTPTEAKKLLSENHSVWYNSLREYSSLFEKNFDLPRQRRMFVEREVAGKKPNLGYAYLIRLIDEGYFNTIFTTNFDDLLNEAFFQFSGTRPVVCAHDSAISSITLSSSRPKVIKLHGDYLFDDIKSTVRETESLEENTRRKFAEFARDFGLVVIGYAGCDRSVMDVLHHLLRADDYFKHGIYWCLRRGDEPSDELIKLLWRDRVYFVQIDGFDEVMGSLHDNLVGDSLPVDTSVVTSKPREIVKGFCENAYLATSTSPVIKRDLDRLRKMDEREHFLNVMRSLGEATNEDGEESEELQEGELITVIEIKQLIAGGDLGGARARVATELESGPRRKLRKELIDFKISIEERAGDAQAALKSLDELINEDPRHSEFYVRKSFLVGGFSERVSVLKEAELHCAPSYRVANRLLQCISSAYGAEIDASRDQLLDNFDKALENSLRLDPGPRNAAWRIALDFYSRRSLPKALRVKKLGELVEKCQSFGERRLLGLQARLAQLKIDADSKLDADVEKFIANIKDAREWAQKDDKAAFDWLEIDLYEDLDMKPALMRRLDELEALPDFDGKAELFRRRADAVMKASGDVVTAVSYLERANKLEQLFPSMLRLAGLYELTGQSQKVSDLIGQVEKFLYPRQRQLLLRIKAAAAKDYEAALTHLRASFLPGHVRLPERIEEVHTLIKLKRYPEALDVAKPVLEQMDWNKSDCGELIINYELAHLRNGGTVKKTRLSDLADATSREEVRACCYYMIGNTEKSKKSFVDIMRKDREKVALFESWALFDDSRGRSFFEGLVREVR